MRFNRVQLSALDWSPKLKPSSLIKLPFDETTPEQRFRLLVASIFGLVWSSH